MSDLQGFRERLGGAIRSRRRAARVTQEGLAERVGSSTEWVSQVERGLGMPSLDLLLRLSEALDCSALQLLEAGLDPGTGRERLQELMAIAKSVPEADLAVLIATAKALIDARA